MILFELLTGQKPHPGDSYNAILYHILTQAPLDLAALRPGLPREACALVQRTLASQADPLGTNIGTFRLSSATNAEDSIVYIDFGGPNILLHDGRADWPVVPYVVGHWAHIELRDMGWVAHTYFFVDGVQNGGTLPMSGVANSVGRIDLFSSRNDVAAPAPVVYFDEIELR